MPYGNRWYRVGSWFECQITGHGKLCDIRIGRLHIWWQSKHWFIA